MSARDVDGDLLRIRRLLAHIAREHGTSAPTDGIDFTELLAFLDSVGEDPAAFFAVAFMPWREVDFESVRATLISIDGENWHDGIVRLKQSLEGVLEAAPELAFSAQESTEEILRPRPGDLAVN